MGELGHGKADEGGKGERGKRSLGLRFVRDDLDVWTAEVTTLGCVDRRS